MTKIAKYRDRLPQRSHQIFLTDGGSYRLKLVTA